MRSLKRCRSFRTDISQAKACATSTLRIEVRGERLDIDCDLHLVTDHQAAAIQDRAPAHTEIVPLDYSPSGESGARYRATVGAAGPVRCLPGSQELNVEGHLAGDAADGEIAGDAELMAGGLIHASAPKGNSRMVFNVEEVRTLEMRIPIRFACPESGDVNDRLDGTSRGVLRIKFHRPLHILDMPAHPGHHHVPGGELSG